MGQRGATEGVVEHFRTKLRREGGGRAGDGCEEGQVGVLRVHVMVRLIGPSEEHMMIPRCVLRAPGG